MEERGSPFGEPCFLCMGRTEICISDDWDGVISLRCRSFDWALWKNTKGENHPDNDIGYRCGRADIL